MSSGRSIECRDILRLSMSEQMPARKGGLVEAAAIEREGMILKTVIPDHSFIVAQALASMHRQVVRVELNELRDIFAWLDVQEEQDQLRKAALATKNNLSSDRSDIWREELSSRTDPLTLWQCAEQRVCNCFHRSIFFQLLIQHIERDGLILEGRAIETSRATLGFDPAIAPFLEGGDLHLEEGETEEAHLWNIVQWDNEYYLVDTALTDAGRPMIQKVPFDNQLTGTLTIQLSNGKYRHYLSNGTVSVEKI